MKALSFFCVLVFLCAISCNQSSNQTPNAKAAETPQPKQVMEEIYSTVSVKNYSLTLKNLDENCVLFYKNERIEGADSQGSFTLDFSAPCEFVRLPGDSEKVQSYTYGKAGKDKKVTVVIITGGSTKSDVLLKDKFQPQGCGTEIQKIRIFDDSVKKADPAVKLSAPVCPSTGLDEVFFAA